MDKPTYTDEDLARIREDELTPREYNGKEYTKYEATQRQRELERTMRARRASIKALEDGGADEDSIILERASYRALSQEYTRFSKAMGLREQRERVMIDGLGNVGVGKWKENVPKVLTNVSDSGKIVIAKRKISGVNIGDPMPSDQFERIQKRASAIGIMIASDEESERYVLTRNAEGITLNSETICLIRHPSRVAVFEELIHATQYRLGKIDGSPLSIARAEVEAKEKLLQYAKAYHLTELEIDITKRILKSDKETLRNLLKEGG